MVSTQTVTIKRASHGLHTTCHLEMDVSVFVWFLYEGYTHTYIYKVYIYTPETYMHTTTKDSWRTCYQRSTRKYRIYTINISGQKEILKPNKNNKTQVGLSANSTMEVHAYEKTTRKYRIYTINISWQSRIVEIEQKFTKIRWSQDK